ncbi:MAG: hypothetical protein WKF75_14780 [Singulisphaera sp.]
MTLDCNGRGPCERGPKPGDRAGPGALQLHGRAGRLNTNRAVPGQGRPARLRRGLRLRPESQVLCRDDRKSFAWQPLSKEAAIEPVDDACPHRVHPHRPGHRAGRDEESAPP